MFRLVKCRSLLAGCNRCLSNIAYSQNTVSSILRFGATKRWEKIECILKSSSSVSKVIDECISDDVRKLKMNPSTVRTKLSYYYLVNSCIEQKSSLVWDLLDHSKHNKKLREILKLRVLIRACRTVDLVDTSGTADGSCFSFVSVEDKLVSYLVNWLPCTDASAWGRQLGTLLKEHRDIDLSALWMKLLHRLAVDLPTNIDETVSIGGEVETQTVTRLQVLSVISGTGFISITKNGNASIGNEFLQNVQKLGFLQPCSLPEVVFSGILNSVFFVHKPSKDVSKDVSYKRKYDVWNATLVTLMMSVCHSNTANAVHLREQLVKKLYFHRCNSFLVNSFSEHMMSSPQLLATTSTGNVFLKLAKNMRSSQASRWKNRILAWMVYNEEHRLMGVSKHAQDAGDTGALLWDSFSCGPNYESYLSPHTHNFNPTLSHHSITPICFLAIISNILEKPQLKPPTVHFLFDAMGSAVADKHYKLAMQVIDLAHMYSKVGKSMRLRRGFIDMEVINAGHYDDHAPQPDTMLLRDIPICDMNRKVQRANVELPQTAQNLPADEMIDPPNIADMSKLYSMAIVVASAQGLDKVSADLLKMMFGAQLKVTGECMYSVMNCFNRKGRYAEVITLFGQMDNWSIKKEAPHHGQYIMAHAFKGLLSDAVVLMRQQPQTQDLPYYHLCNMLLKAASINTFKDKSNSPVLTSHELIGEVRHFIPFALDSKSDISKQKRLRMKAKFEHILGIADTSQDISDEDKVDKQVLPPSGLSSELKAELSDIYSQYFNHSADSDRSEGL